MMEKKVSVIKAITRDEIIKTAAYARVSSNSEDQIHSFKSQVAYYSQYIGQLKNHVLVDIYTDEGITGTMIEKRNGFKKMIEDCKKGKINKIITKSIDRFGRNFTETLKTLRELKCLGVSVYFEKENIDTKENISEISITSNMMAAEWESKNISSNQRWGFRTRAERGIYNQPHLPYGYFRDNGEIKINEKEADIIRMMFDMYVNQDFSTVAIEKFLNQNKIGNRKWSRSGIVLMLTNERYCGDQLLQKKFTTDEFPYHLVLNKGEMPQYYVYDTFPSIIDRSLYEASYAKWESGKDKLSEKQLSANMKYAYTSKIMCGECHETFKRRVYHGEEFWCCRNHLLDKNICATKQIAKHELNEAFLRLYYKLRNSLDILEAYESNLTNLLKNDVRACELLKLDKEISKLNQKKVQVMQKNFEGNIKDTELISNLNEIQMQRSLVELEKRKILNDLYEKYSIIENQKLVSFLKKAGQIESFNEFIFQKIVKMIRIDQDYIHFQLINELSVKIERRKYHGNYER